MHALETKTSELKTTTGSHVGIFQEIKVRAVETERDLTKAQKTVAVSDSQQELLADKVSSMTEELSSMRLGRANIKAVLDEIKSLVQRMKDNIKASLLNGSTALRKMYKDTVEAVKLEIQVDLVDWWKRWIITFRLSGDELLHRFSDEQSSLEKNSALFSSCTTKALDVVSSRS